MQYLLLKSQKNTVFELIQEHGFDIRAFELQESSSLVIKREVRYGSGIKRTEGHNVHKLVHKSSGFYFVFDHHPAGLRQSRYSPGYETLEVVNPVGDWNSQASDVNRWLSNLKREIEAPDHWAALDSLQIEDDTAGLPIITDNTPFSDDEKQRIKAELGEFDVFLRTKVELPEGRLHLIEEDLSYLVAAADRQGRRDWSFTFRGVVLGWIIDRTLTAENIGIVLAFSLKALHSLTNQLPALLP